MNGFSVIADILLAPQVLLWVTLALGLAVVIGCAAVYGRLLQRAIAGQGKVWADAFGLPDVLAMTVLCTWLIAGAVHGFLRPEPTPVTKTLLVVTIILYGAVVVGIGVFLWAREIPLVRLFGLYPTRLFEALKRGVQLLVLAVPLVLFCSWIVRLVMGEEAEPQELVKFFADAARHSDWGRVGLAAGTAVFVAPLTEEFLFRGYFYGVLRRYLGVVPALLFTSALFAAIHVSASAFLPLFVLAVCLTLAYEATGSLLTTILMHALFNAAMLAGTFYSARHP